MRPSRVKPVLLVERANPTSYDSKFKTEFGAGRRPNDGQRLSCTEIKIERLPPRILIPLSFRTSDLSFPVGPETVKIVAEYIDMLTGELGFGPDDPLFPATEIRQGSDRA